MTGVAIETGWGGAPYVRSDAIVTFACAGTPQPQGNHRVTISKTGKAIIRDAVKGLKPWRDEVTKAVAVAMRQVVIEPDGGFPLLGPVAVDLFFTMPKPKSAPVRRRTYPTTRPDIDKLARAVMDSLVFASCISDDAQVVALRCSKSYPSETPRALRVPGVVGIVYQIER